MYQHGADGLGYTWQGTYSKEEVEWLDTLRAKDSARNRKLAKAMTAWRKAELELPLLAYVSLHEKPIGAMLVHESL